jgi:hypothetical protein
MFINISTKNLAALAQSPSITRADQRLAACSPYIYQIRKEVNRICSCLAGLTHDTIDNFALLLTFLA